MKTKLWIRRLDRMLFNRPKPLNARRNIDPRRLLRERKIVLKMPRLGLQQ